MRFPAIQSADFSGEQGMAVTAIYASALTVLFVVLALRVIAGRRAARVALGDGGDAGLLRRMRVHANFAEYVPLALVLMGLAESLRTDTRVLHALGIGLLAARLLHAFGVSQQGEQLAFRQVGMVGTFAVLLAAAGVGLAGALRSGVIF